MNFLQALARFNGRQVEIFQSTQYINGRLLGVGTGFFSVETSPSSYGSGSPLTVLESRTELIRILPE